MIEIGGHKVGAGHFALIAGPCAVESREQVLSTAHAVAAAGASMFRGGAYKPRTSPYAFQGLGREGLQLLAEAKAQSGLPIVTELIDVRDLEEVLEVADVIQIGARNMQNYPLLAEVGRCGCPVLLKRGICATLDELLMACRVHPQGGQPQRDAVRAGHPHLRDRLPLHPGSDGCTGAQAAHATAGDRRSQPCRWAREIWCARSRWRPRPPAQTG